MAMVERIAFWLSGHNSIRTPMPNTISTQPYARFSDSCIQSSTGRMA